MTSTDPAIWVLADPRAGTAAQALGIAEAMGEPFRTIPLAWSPWARLPLRWATLIGLSRDCRAQLRPPWPSLVISAGRRAAPVALWLAGQGVRTVHCMDPGFARARFDLLVIGRHDEPPARANILPILGATHRMSAEPLRVARETFAEFAALPPPRVVLLLGGPVRGKGMDPAIATAIAAQARTLGASVLASASRRTGAAATDALAKALDGVPHRLFRWGDTGPNPYAGFLAWADLLVVTGDSVSMLSEALATAAPLLIADPGGLGPRHRLLSESLVGAGLAAPLGTGTPPGPRAVLDETGRVAAEARKLMVRGDAGGDAGAVALSRPR
ncbi:MAG: mitochondrial fission ELM1 family protein [Pseudomonadota bacterium]